jgi:RHS repeat-associated protein
MAAKFGGETNATAAPLPASAASAGSGVEPGMTLPSINMPKGGGAIRSIGDSFTVQTMSGTGSLTVPIPVTAGRSGLGPNLTLRYDSGHGNGPFGIGWAVSLPSITRRTDRGLPQYFDEIDSDVFVWSGAEDLVPVPTEGQLDDDQTDPGYVIRRYRPRVDHQHARIERWVNRADTTDVHWRSISPDNVLTIYGLGAGERVADPKNPEHVFTWLISHTRDAYGNAVLYEYKPEDGAGIDLGVLSESGRGDVADPRRAANRHPKRIRYGNAAPLLDAAGNRPRHVTQATLDTAEWYFEVIFDYGEHALDAPTPDPGGGVWSARPDAFSTYRSGFEVRCARLARRILMFHHFPLADPAADALVGSLTFGYAESPIGSLLTSITESGHRLEAPGKYVTRSMPPVEFTYTDAVISETLGVVDRTSIENVPAGVDGFQYRFTDLDGEGIPGILTERDGSWRYKRSLGDGRFEPGLPLPRVPLTAGSPSATLMDLNGAGTLDLVDYAGPAPGFHRRTADGGWEPHLDFRDLPSRDWRDPNLRSTDLVGDGLTDLLITRDSDIAWHHSLGEVGLSPELCGQLSTREGRRPRLMFADGTNTLFLADMSGDGLSDLVRIRNHEISYWPNIGYGRFGPERPMDNAPLLDRPECFDGKRIRLADIDGSGTTDLIYLGAQGVTVYRNQSGNSWSDPQPLTSFPPYASTASITAADVKGNGTSCLIHSSSLPADAGAPMRYLDMMGGTKPNLLVKIVNNLGAETRVTYQPSTTFYLRDKAAGVPWLTRLPFPVQVVERVETIDLIGRTRYVSRYAYHHGYYDGVEREYRGFAVVDQSDTEERTDLVSDPADAFGNEDAESWQPPVHIRSWFHTGAPHDVTVARHLAAEYWVPPALRGDEHQIEREALELPDSTLPGGLSTSDRREAFRALRGTPLRLEVTTSDGTIDADIPYEVTEQRVEARLIQARGANRHAVFTVHPTETTHFQYDRVPADPRITHNINLETDAFGNIIRTIAIGYGRRIAPEPEPGLTPGVIASLAHDQQRVHVRATHTEYTNDLADPARTPDTHHTPKPSVVTNADLTGPPFTAAAPLLRRDALEQAWQAGWANPVPSERLAASDVDGAGRHPAAATARVVSQSVTVYRSDDLTRLLDVGHLDTRALPGQNYRLALTAGLLAGPLAGRATPDILTDGGYLQLAGRNGWWAPSSRLYYTGAAGDQPARELAGAVSHFFRPVRGVDPFGGTSVVTLDPYDLLPVQHIDPVDNLTASVNDYRVMHPTVTTDANGNRAAVAFDCLGVVSGTAVTGKNGEGDTLEGFDPDLTDLQVAAVLADPIGQSGALLGRATARIVTDRSAYWRTRAAPSPDPPAVCVTTRETHAADLRAGDQSRLQYVLIYYDGLGREAQHKAQAEPGPVPGFAGDRSPRWIGSGWTIYNNKGKPTRTYEPFFTATHAFEFAPASSVSIDLLYDAIGRVIVTAHPDGTFEKTVYSPWRETTFDANDTVRVTDPTTDPDVGAAFGRLLSAGGQPWTSWYDDRIRGTLGADPDERGANRDAARKAAAHAGTPTVAHFDSLGRICLSVLDNGADPADRPHRYPTRTALATDGKPLAVVDALGRRAIEYCTRDTRGPQLSYLSGYDLIGRTIYHVSADRGARRTLCRVDGAELRVWDDRGQAFRSRYDPAGRETHRYVLDASGERLLRRRIYGEHHPDQAANLKGRLFRDYDSAGVMSNDRYDFKGNVAAAARQLTKHRAVVPTPWESTDWSAIDAVPDIPLVDVGLLTAAAEAELDPTDAFSSSTSFDALNRPTQMILPHQAGTPVSVVQSTYNAANLIMTVHLWVRLGAPPGALLDPATSTVPAVTGIDYNEHGQRLAIARGNGTMTTQTFDPQTHRLTRITTKRPGPRAAATVQDLRYTYDAHGNITRLRDDADIQAVVFFRNQRVDPTADYTYDPSYRLIRATGREHLGQNGPGRRNPAAQPTNSDAPRTQSPAGRAILNPGDGNAMGQYTETYYHDAVGNFSTMVHRTRGAGWTRRYTYTEASRISAGETGNRLSATSAPGDLENGPYSAHYSYDMHGNTTSMPHLPLMLWDELDRLAATSTQVVNDGLPETTCYTYESGGERIRKETYSAAVAGADPVLKGERIYLGAIEIHRTYTDGAISVERETMHGLLDHRTLVSVETRTQDAAATDLGPAQMVRHQYSNHLGNAILELDNRTAIISYEEYFPYGSTAYQAVRSATETPKRYRFTNQERDEENDLYYHGARYYIPWLGRWTACDPAGISEGPNFYLYAHANPISFSDPTGMWGYAGNNPVSTDGPSNLAANSSEQEERQKSLATGVSGGGGTGVRFGAPEGPTLRVPDTYGPKKMGAYGRGVVERRIGKVTGTKPLRNDPAHKAGERAFKKTSKPTAEAPSGRWEADHLIEQQHDILGKSGTRVRDFQWQDLKLNRSEGAKSRHLQAEHPGITPEQMAAGERPPTIYGGVARAAEAGRWYNSVVTRAVGRGVGTAMALYGAYQSADAVAGAVTKDALSETSYGQYTAREVARQAGGWAGALALGVKGAAFGAAITAPLGGVGALLGGPIGGLVGGAVGFFAGSRAATAAIDIGVSATGGRQYVPHDAY